MRKLGDRSEQQRDAQAGYFGERKMSPLTVTAFSFGACLSPRVLKYHATCENLTPFCHFGGYGAA